MNTTRSITLLRQRLEELETLEPRENAAFMEWFERTVTTVSQALPSDHRAHNRITTAHWSPMVYPASAEAYQSSFESGRGQVRAVLKAAIYELEEFAAAEVDASQPILAVHEVKLLERVVGELRKADEDGNLDQLDPEIHAEVAAEVQTLESQLRSPKPKRSIVKAALQSLRNIAEEAVGGAMGAGVVVAVKMGAEGIL